MLQVCTNNAIPTTKEIKERRILSSTLTQYCMLLHKGQVHSDFVCCMGGRVFQSFAVEYSNDTLLR